MRGISDYHFYILSDTVISGLTEVWVPRLFMLLILFCYSLLLSFTAFSDFHRLIEMAKHMTVNWSVQMKLKEIISKFYLKQSIYYSSIYHMLIIKKYLIVNKSNMIWKSIKLVKTQES